MPRAAAPPSHTHSLRAAGMRQTPQREAILKVLKESERPLTAEEIWSGMEKRRSGIPTVYRNLERFVSEGWAESLQGADQVMRFVLCRSSHHHHHLTCETCGRTVEVDGCALEANLAAMEKASGFLITRHQLTLFGKCPACQAAIQA